NVFNYFGVNEAVLQNKATDEQLDSFFDGAIEPFSIQLSQVLEKMLFTNREISVGNHVYVAANRLQYMSTTHKINMAQQLGDRGMITINEVRELFNYPPLPEGGDKAPIRGEYYFAGEEKTDGNDGQN
ncbi:MAG: phage portal protein, partial [Clostridia bacterium]|nr:phage portal protein [Clostridia bacterium]